MNSPLRDSRIGKLLAARGCKAIAQAEVGGTPLDNVIRMADWRNRYATIPVEETQPREQPVGPLARPIDTTKRRLSLAR